MWAPDRPSPTGRTLHSQVRARGVNRRAHQRMRTPRAVAEGARILRHSTLSKQSLYLIAKLALTSAWTTILPTLTGISSGTGWSPVTFWITFCVHIL